MVAPGVVVDRMSSAPFSTSPLFRFAVGLSAIEAAAMAWDTKPTHNRMDRIRDSFLIRMSVHLCFL